MISLQVQFQESRRPQLSHRVDEKNAVPSRQTTDTPAIGCQNNK